MVLLFFSQTTISTLLKGVFGWRKSEQASIIAFITSIGG